MNHGRLGYISNRSLRLPPDILDQMGLRVGNLLFGIYYPPKGSDPNYAGRTVDDDFMLTPLFPEVWDRTGCFIIRLKHKAEAFAKIAKFLADNNLSIYCSECTRSAYRYATWNLHVVITGLEAPLNYDKNQSGYKETIRYLDRMQRKMENECHEVLFQDPHEPDLESPIKLLHLSALSYFAQHNKTQCSPHNLPLKPFRLRVDKDGFLNDVEGDFANVLSAIRTEHKRDLRNSVFFVEADRRNYNMRLAVFAGPQKNTLFVARAKYTSRGDWNGFRGLLARIAMKLPPSCKIWKCSNEKLEVRHNHEEGIIKMIVEDGQVNVDDGEKIERITNAFVCPDQKYAPLTEVHRPLVRLASVGYCRLRIATDFARETPDEPLVFISYPSRERDKAKQIRKSLAQKGVKGWLDNKDLGPGKWLEQVKKALKNSIELVLLWTKECHDSDWVTMEWQTAIILEIPITIFFLDSTVRVRSLPKQLQDYQAFAYDDSKVRNEVLEEIAKTVQEEALSRTY